MGHIKQLIEQYIPGIYVYSMEIGDSVEADEFNGFFMNANDQIKEAINRISTNPNLTNGFNAVGFSQGSQFLRGYVERDNTPPVHNLISIGGQHQGVFGVPQCPGANYTLCEWFRELFDLGVYDSFVQRHLAQSNYWHDPWNPSEYEKYCIYLPDINNEITINQQYKQNMISLNSFVMVKFTLDTMVQPIESEWFGFYESGSDSVVLPMRNTTLYQQDWIGLKTLDSQNKLQFMSVAGNHLQFTDQWFIQNIIPLLNNYIDE